MRDADVTEAVRQNSCATQQMNSRSSDQVWLIDSAQIHGTMIPKLSIAPCVSGIASVTATSRMNPKKTDTTTAMYMPTAAAREASCVSSAMCAEASNPVIVYCAIARPGQEDVPEHRRRERAAAAAEPGLVDRLREHVPE